MINLLHLYVNNINNSLNYNTNIDLKDDASHHDASSKSELYVLSSSVTCLFSKTTDLGRQLLYFFQSGDNINNNSETNDITIIIMNNLGHIITGSRSPILSINWILGLTFIQSRSGLPRYTAPMLRSFCRFWRHFCIHFSSLVFALIFTWILTSF